MNTKCKTGVSADTTVLHGASYQKCQVRKAFNCHLLGNFEVTNTTLLHYVLDVIADRPVQKKKMQLPRFYTRGAIYRLHTQ
jgi:hypothetical protein